MCRRPGLKLVFIVSLCIQSRLGFSVNSQPDSRWLMLITLSLWKTMTPLVVYLLAAILNMRRAIVRENEFQPWTHSMTPPGCTASACPRRGVGPRKRFRIYPLDLTPP